MSGSQIFVSMGSALEYRDNVVGGDVALESERFEAEPARELVSPSVINHPLFVTLVFRALVVPVRHISICLLATLYLVYV